MSGVAGRMVIQPETLLCAPGIARAYRPGRKTPATGRTDIVQDGFHTANAIGAFIRTDASVSGLWWQIAIAKLAVGAQFKQ